MVLLVNPLIRLTISCAELVLLPLYFELVATLTAKVLIKVVYLCFTVILLEQRLVMLFFMRYKGIFGASCHANRNCLNQSCIFVLYSNFTWAEANNFDAIEWNVKQDFNICHLHYLTLCFFLLYAYLFWGIFWTSFSTNWTNRLLVTEFLVDYINHI